MTPSEFLIYISSYIDLNPGVPPTASQWAIINAKLDSVFNKVTPDRTIVQTPPHFATTEGARIIPIATGAPGTPHGPVIVGTGDSRQFWKAPITGLGIWPSSVYHTC